VRTSIKFENVFQAAAGRPIPLKAGVNTTGVETLKRG
jgi:hypothetical protein